MSAKRKPAETSTHAKLAYATSEWQRLLFEIRRDRSKAVGNAILQTSKVIEEGLVEQEDNKNAVARVRSFAHSTADALGTEVFSRLYNEPAKLDEPKCPRWVPTLHEALSQLPEFTELASRVVGDPDLAAIASASMMRAASEQLADIMKDEDQNEDFDGDWDKLNDPVLDENGEESDLPTAVDMMRAAMRDAAEKANEEIVEVKSGLSGLSPGLEVAPPGYSQKEDTGRMQLAEHLMSNKRLRDVIRRAGRIQRIAASKKRVRTTDARTEVVSIERGADLSRVLPSQLVGLRHPKLRLLTLAKVVERSLLQYALDGTEVLGRGPMTVLLDRSGSMSGQPHQLACAIALSCMQTAIKEKRAVTFIGFNGGVCSVHRLDEKRRAYRVDVDTYTGRTRGETALGGPADIALELVTARVGGGTDFNPPLKYALNGQAADDRSDIVFVTDGHASASSSVMAELARRREETGMRVFGLTVARGSITGAMREICDEVVDLKNHDDKERGAANVVPRR